MKTLLKLKSLVALVVVTAAISACGSSGNGDRFTNRNNFLETDFRIIQPQANSVLSTRGPVIVEVSERSEFCDNPDAIKQFLRITLSTERNINNPAFPVEFGPAITADGSSADTCQITVLLASNLLPGTDYVLYRSENTSGTTSFSSNNGVPFRASDVLESFDLLEALSPQFKILENADLFLGGGADDIDEDAFLDWLISAVADGAFSQFIGVGLSANATIKAGFNEPVLANDLAGNTYVYEFNGTVQNIVNLIQSGSLTLNDFQLLSGAGEVGCSGPDGSCVYLDSAFGGHVVNFEGPWQSGKSYMVILSEDLLSVNMSQLNTTWYRLFNIQ